MKYCIVPKKHFKLLVSAAAILGLLSKMAANEFMHTVYLTSVFPASVLLLIMNIVTVALDPQTILTCYDETQCQ